MAQIILWYILATLTGLFAFPLTFRFLIALPDRGYSVSRVLGLLIWGYIFWILGTFKFLANQASSLVFSLLLVAVAGLVATVRLDKGALVSWWRDQRKFVLVVEILFLLSFAGWAFVRGTNPEAIGTEKPMELAFINGILASPSFPPHDPWLSGYSISYYYFGYILVAMLAKISATSGAVAFNLGISLVFALSAISAYGLVYNLLARRNLAPDLNEQQSRKLPGLLYALFGPLYVLIASNLEGFLHLLHSRGIFWGRDPNGQLVSAFWKWLDINDLKSPPAEPFTWFTDRFWWWWRASRVVQDYDLAGNPKEIIDEFPFFSYLLADLHPHVLAMPFAFLAITLALNALFNTHRGLLSLFHWQVNVRTVTWGALGLIPVSVVMIGTGFDQLNFLQAGLGVCLLTLAGFVMLRMWDSLSEHGIRILSRTDLGSLEVGRVLQIEPAQFLLAAVVLGSMAFLNTWDFPLYVGLFSAAHALGLIMSGQADLKQRIREFFWLSICLGLAGGVFFLPFYLGFSSQVGGIIPNLIYATRGAHLWVMFAPLMVPLFVFLVYLVTTSHSSKRLLAKGLLWGSLVVAGLWAVALLIGLIIAFSGLILPNASQLFQATLASPGTTALFQSALVRRLTNPGGWITLLALLSLSLAVMHWLTEAVRKQNNDEETRETSPFNPSVAFALLLILFGTLLVLGPEFFYLQDQFGWRMNTIFKFYYQVWLIWGLVAAFSTAFLLENLKRLGGVIWRIALICLLTASLVYPILSLVSKTNGFQVSDWTLDSSDYLESQSPDVMAAIRWLKAAPPGTIAEAVPSSGGSYTGNAIFSTLTGMPAVLGWYGHESQWRGGGELLGPRQTDLRTLYCSRDWQETKIVLDRYQIRYVILGNLEKEAYRPGENGCPAGVYESKFERYLLPVFEQGSVTVYEYEQPGIN